MTNASTIDSLDILLEDLVIRPPSSVGSLRVQEYQDFAFRRAATILRSDSEDASRWKFELRLRLALHLAPVSAIKYDHANPTPRWELVRDHLVRHFERDPVECERLARDVAVTLENWEHERRDVTAHRSFLIRRDGATCRHCHVRFGSTPVTVRTGDEFKPYFKSPDELLMMEVDHVEAISALGTNAVENLQLLCRLCNFGKGDGLGLDVRREAHYAGRSIAGIPIQHRATMLYYVIARDNRRCRRCDGEDLELTIRPLVASGGFLRSNLQATCVACCS
jgi:hypothetical protein